MYYCIIHAAKIQQIIDLDIYIAHDILLKIHKLNLATCQLIGIQLSYIEDITACFQFKFCLCAAVEVQAVYDFNMDIEQGEFIVLVGPSGCGKSTTLRMIAGLEDISGGELPVCILVAGFHSSPAFSR